MRLGRCASYRWRKNCSCKCADARGCSSVATPESVGRPSSSSSRALPEISARKSMKPRRFDVAIGVLLRDPVLRAKLGGVSAMHPGQVVQELIDVGGAECCGLLDSSPRRREPGDRDGRESEIACVSGNRRQSHLGIDVLRDILLIHALGDAVEPGAKFVQQRRREGVRFGDHGILVAAGNVVAVAGHQGKAGTGERLEQAVVAETIAEGQLRRGRQRMIDAQIELIGARCGRRGKTHSSGWPRCGWAVDIARRWPGRWDPGRRSG